MISTKLRDYLDKTGVAYTHHPHPTAYTAQQIAEFTHVPGEQFVKSVLLKGDGGLVMAVLSSNYKANLEALRQEIGSGALRLATEDEFRDIFPTCKVGAMPPFGNLFDLETYCEASLEKNQQIEFNAGTHEETIRMEFDDFKRLVNPKLVHFARPYQEQTQRRAG